MRTFATPLLALALLTTTLVAFPAAEAERMCLTAGDTLYFYLKYLAGSSYSDARQQLEQLGCPDIDITICRYYYHPRFCAVYPTTFDATLLGAATLHGEVVVGPSGVYVDAREDVLVATLEGNGVGSPGALVDSILDGTDRVPLLP